MNIAFKTNKLKRQLTDAKATQKRFGELTSKIHQRLRQLEAVEHLGILNAHPAFQGFRLHAYSGDRAGQWSIDLKNNWRMIFEIDHDPLPRADNGGIIFEQVTNIRIVSIEDPH